MLGLLRRALVRPEVTLQNRQTTLAGPLALAFALGVVVVAGALIPGFLILENNLPSLLPDSPPITLATRSGAVTIPSLQLKIMVLALASPVVIWIATGTVVHGLLALVTVSGSIARGTFSRPRTRPTMASLAARLDAFRRTFVAVGWGYAPQILASLFTAILFVTTYGANPDLIVRWVQFTLAGHIVVVAPAFPFLTAGTHVVGAASVFWTGYVWVGTLQATRGVSRRTALAVVVPVATVLLITSDVVGLVRMVR